jgi:AcrR family transcriptional regulator
MKLTRPLLNHYFKTRENLFEMTAEYVRLTIQEIVVEHLKMTTSSDEMIITYIKINLDWINQNPNHLKFWIHFMTMSTHDKSCRKKNTAYVEMGQRRINEIINLGIKDKKIKILIGDSESMARSIQFLITGYLLSFATENRSNNEIIKQRKNIIVLSCKMLGISHAKYID